MLTVSLSHVQTNKNITSNTTIRNVTVSGYSSDITKIVEEINTSNVVISSENSIGSGFIYEQNEEKIFIISAYHTVSDSSAIDVYLANNQRFEANVLAFDPYLDLALLEIDKTVEVNNVKLGDATLLKDGEFIFMMGCPSNIELANSLSLGLVSSFLRTITNSVRIDGKTYDYYLQDIQLSANVANGYSGAAVYNSAGEVVGVITMSSRNGEVFATPINEVNKFYETALSKEEKEVLPLNIKGSFINLMELYTKNNLAINLEVNEGLYVEDVKLNSVFKDLGIRKGDIILTINGMKLNSYKDYLNIKYSDLSELKAEVFRDNEYLELVGTYTND